MARAAVIAQLADLILRAHCPHPLRVAIDGVDAAGKTMLADELAAPLRQSGRQVIRASVDGFHNPRAVRRQRGEFSPEGFYLDSYNYAALKDSLLLPLGPGGDRRYRTACFDLAQDCPMEAAPQTAPVDAILLLDGIFLLRPELAGLWDFSIFVQASFAVTLQRALLRDRDLIGSAEAVEEKYHRRYIPGQEIYLAQAQPERAADVVFINDDPDHPVLNIKN